MLLLSIPSILILATLYRLHALRISRLASHMKAVDLDRGSAFYTVNSHDEIGMLENSFNEMIAHARQMMAEKQAMDRQVQQLELRLLQAQIKPHLLYNTLDLIYWAASKGDSPAVQEIVTDLTQYYRFSLRGGNTLSTLGSEIEHIRYYLRIQNRRFDQQVVLAVEADERLLALHVPQFLLQPIVENALMHGIMEKPTKDARITIASTQEGDDLVLRITDNGAGMTVIQCEAILSTPQNHETFSGYGLKNLQDRLKLLHPDNSIRFQSVRGDYTTVEVRIRVTL